MRNILSWLIGLPLAVLIVVFALSNRDAMTLGLWPFADGLALPVYLVVLAPLLLGLALGLGWNAVALLRSRHALAGQRRRVTVLERELETLRNPAAPAGEKVVTITKDLVPPP